MTAMVTGIKTNQGVLGVNQNVDATTTAPRPSGKSVATLLEVAEALGLATGIVTHRAHHPRDAGGDLRAYAEPRLGERRRAHRRSQRAAAARTSPAS